MEKKEGGRQTPKYDFVDLSMICNLGDQIISLQGPPRDIPSKMKRKQSSGNLMPNTLYTYKVHMKEQGKEKLIKERKL